MEKTSTNVSAWETFEGRIASFGIIARHKTTVNTKEYARLQVSIFLAQLILGWIFIFTSF